MTFARISTIIIALLLVLQSVAFAAPITLNASTQSGYFPSQAMIGTTSAGKALEVVGDITARASATSGGIASMLNADASGAGLWINGAYNPAAAGTGWTRGLTVTTSGQVGIGTVSPGRALGVASTSFPQVGITNSNNAESSIMFVSAGRTWTMGSDGGGINDGFFINDQGVGQTRLVINTDGEVGIGTTDPQVRLDVSGSARIGGALGVGAVPSAMLDVADMETPFDKALSVVKYSSSDATSDSYGVYSSLSMDATAYYNEYAGYFATEDGGSAIESYGVYAVAGKTGAETSIGVYGTGFTTGVFGNNNAATGIGVRANQINPSGYALYSTGGKNYLQGNVGIGTTSPSAQLHVNGTGNVRAYVTTPTYASTSGLRLNGWDIYDNVSAGRFYVRDAPYALDVLTILGGGTGLVTINSGVGGGLTVASGSVSLPANQIDSSEVSFNYAGSSSKGGAASDLACTDCVSASEVQFNYAGSSSEGGAATSALTANSLAANGANCAAGSYPLGIDASGAAEGCTVAVSSSALANYIPKMSSGTALVNSVIQESSSNIGIGMSPSYKLDVSGNMRASGYFHPSDARLKKNIAPIAAGLPTIMALEPVTYEWKAGDGSVHTGFIAQDIETVLPQAVSTDASGIKAVEYTELIAPLVAAVQEQQAQIESQQQQIEALRAEIQMLKRK